MIDFTFFSDIIANIVSFFFSFFAEVDLSPIHGALEFFSKYIKAALYILPAQTIAQMFSIVCVLWSFRMFIKTIMLIYSLLPIL